MAQDPSVTRKVSQVAKQFGMFWNRLHFRLRGGQSKTELKLVNKNFSEPEERAICNYINGLDRINPTVAVLKVVPVKRYETGTVDGFSCLGMGILLP